MTTLVVLVLLLFGFRSVPDEVDRTIYLRADIKSSSHSRPTINVRLDGNKTEECELPGKSSDKPPASAICSFQAAVGVHDVFVEIKFPGFKRFSRNVALFQVTKDATFLDLGPIVLSPSEIPKVEKIDIGLSTDSKNILLQVDLLNPRANRFHEVGS
jgi:hypothetical protein